MMAGRIQLWSNDYFFALLFAAFMFGTVGAGGAVDAKLYFVSMATGPLAGVYYSIGRAICDAANKEKSGLYCSVEPTPGSVYNVEAVAAGEDDFALMQSNVQFAAMTGTADWDGHPVGSLRSLMSLYSEALTIISRPDSGINGVESLKDKRLNIGPPGSGTRATWDELEAALGMTRNDLALATEFLPDAATELLCANKLDASLFVVGHPSKMVERQLSTCRLTLVSATGPSVDKLLSSRLYFVKAVIPAAAYGSANDIATFGSKATLVTSAKVPDEVVYKLTKAVMENLEKLREEQPTLASLQPEEMVQDSLTAPLHPGALKAYKELSLIK
jgi:uncharacterized protein